MQSEVRRTGTLASGNHYTLTTTDITITSPDGNVVYQAMYADLKTIRYYMERVTLEHDERGRVDLQAASTREAQAIVNTIRANRIGQRSTSNRTVFIALGAIGLAVIGILGLGAIGALDERTDSGTDERPRSRPAGDDDLGSRVTYRVTTSGSRHAISLTMENSSGNSEQLDTTTSNGGIWERSFRAEPGAFVYVSAQSMEDASVRIGCEIEADGEVIERANSSGRFVIATCSGSLP